MRRLYSACLCVSVATGLIGCGTLDSPDDVKDLRMLAVRAEPPDQILIPASLQAVPGVSSTLPIDVTTLIADPNGNGRSIAYTLSTCARLNTDNRNCTTASVGYAAVSQGVTQASGGYTELSLPFVPSDDLLLQALTNDPYHGTQGLWLPVQLELTAGQDHVVGTKLLVYTLPPASGIYVPNANPNLAGVSVGDKDWTPAAPFVFSASGVPKDGYIINPVFNRADEQSYAQPTFEGGANPAQEAWLVDYFNTWGGMTPTTAGGASPTAASQALVPASAFKPPADAQLGPGLFWFVVRDGRGGASWLVRSAQLLP